MFQKKRLVVMTGFFFLVSSISWDTQYLFLFSTLISAVSIQKYILYKKERDDLYENQEINLWGTFN